MGRISRRAFEPYDSGRAFSEKQTRRIVDELCEEYGPENVHAHNAFYAHLGAQRRKGRAAKAVQEWFYTIWVRR